MEKLTIALIAALIAGLITVIIELLKPYSREKLKFFFRMIGMIWNKLPFKFIGAIISFIILAFTIMFFYKFHGWFDVFFLSADINELKNEGKLSQESLSNIRRNIWLLGFAIFGGCLAIWARLAHERKLQYTREQMERTERKNNNDRLTKAIELIENIDNRTSSREGLNILRNLADENPKAEYIRCVENICIWLLLHKQKVSKIGLLDKALEIFKIKNTDRLDVAKIIEDNRLGRWPNLQGANLQGANLEEGYLQKANLEFANMKESKLRRVDLRNSNLQSANLWGAYLLGASLQDSYLSEASLQNADLRSANLQGASLYNANLQNADLHTANLQGAILRKSKLQNAVLSGANLQDAEFENANLTDANITNAKMRDAIDLTKEQILSAKWFAKIPKKYSMKKKSPIPRIPPELSKELMKDPDVQRWLENPDDEVISAKKVEAKFKKVTIKKATTKKPKN